jgi:hypothetical protein
MIPRAPVAYESDPTLRTAPVHIMARAMGAFFHLDGVPAIVRNDLMSRRSTADYSMLAWLYSFSV